MKKVLFFTYDFPYPTTSGGKNRAYHMLKFGGREVDLHLFSFTRSDFREEYRSEIEKIGIKKITLFERKNADRKTFAKEIVKSPGNSIFKSLYFDKKIEEQLHAYLLSEKIDIFHAESFYTAFYLSPKIKKLGIKQIYGSENVEYLIYKEFVKSSVPKYFKPFYSYQVKKIEKEERDMVKNADMITVVSDEDKSVFDTISNSSVATIDNGIDIASIRPVEIKNSKTLLFVGNFSYFPNIEAAEDFYTNTFTKLHDVKLIIVGKNAREKLSFVADKNVQVMNFVPDLKDVYINSDIFVFPVRFGGGTNFKVLEAMAYGLPIVGFDDKIKNVKGITGTDYVSVRTFQEMKDAIEKLLGDQNKRIELSIRGRKIIEEQYSWEKIGKNLSKVWQNL